MGPAQQKEEMRGDFSNHQRLKNYKIVRGRNGKEYMEVPCPVFDTKIIPQWQSSVQSIARKECLFLPESFEVVEEGRCGSSGTVRILFEYYPFSLQKEIANRRELKSPLNEQELWFLLYEITSSVLEFESLGRKSGDIRPRNIFINEDGLVKVVNQHSFPDERTNYLKALEDHESAYLSPEELAEFEKGIAHPRSDPVLGEAFSIGLTMLDAALLTDNEELYEMRNLRFNIHRFHENLVKWKESSYSPFLIRTVENLLEINWYERPTAGEVRAVLEPYEEQIRNLEPFAPSKEKSKARLDSYQTGTKGKKSAHEHHFGDLRPQSPPMSMPMSPVSQPVHPVRTNTYHNKHQTPFTSPNSPVYVPALKSPDNLEARSPFERFSAAQQFHPNSTNNVQYRIAVSPPPLEPNQVIRQTSREAMVPASRVKVVPNSRAYLQEQRLQSHRF